MASGNDIPQGWLDTIKQLLAGEIHSAAAPGEFAGKEKSHVPQVTRNEDGTVVVRVPHGMTKGEAGEKDHWIEWVFVKDESDNIVAVSKFAPTDPEAVLSFAAESGKTYTPFEFCNLHGVWQGDSF